MKIRNNRSLFKKFFTLFILLGVSAALTAGPIEIYFGPKGGFSRGNNGRRLIFSDGSVKPPTLANAFLHKLDQCQPGSTVKIAMYSMSDYKTLYKMIDAARDKQIKFKLLLDGAASWSKASREKIVSIVKKASEKAKEAGKEFNFQISSVSAEAMKRNGRKATLDDGREICGTMHEKFGIFYHPDNPIPHSCFCGSSNLSTTSDEIYAENRVFFHDRPAVARQFQENFARLWNEYGTIEFGKYTPEKFIPVNAEAGEVKVIFNAEPVDEMSLTRIDNELLSLIRKVKEDGRLDLAMFSLTRPELAQAIVRRAEQCPEAKFRLLLDHAQLDDSNPKASKLAPWIEEQIKQKGLKNVQIRYKFRRNAYGYNDRKKESELISYLSLFLHHKTVIVNGNEMALGSYNWSGAAEYLNYEDIMLFNGNYADQQKVIDCFFREFDTIWASRLPYSLPSTPRKDALQTVTGPEGRKLHKQLIKLLSTPATHKVHSTMGRGAFKTFKEIKKETGLSHRKVKVALRKLMKARLVCKWNNKGIEGYSQAD